MAKKVFDIKKHVKSSWVSKRRSEVNQPWGKEQMWPGFDGIHGKTLFLKMGNRTSLKYHQLKAEVLFVRSGKVEAVYGDELSLSDPVGHPMQSSILEEGMILMVQSGCPYRLSAHTDCEIIEIGNNIGDKPKRIEDDYGRKCES